MVRPTRPSSAPAARVVGLILTVCLQAACTDPTEPPPPPEVSTCSDGWQHLPTPDLGETTELVWADGYLYVRQYGPDRVLGFSVSGGPMRTIAGTPAMRGLWVESDRLLFAENARLLSVPLTGGEPTQLLDGSSSLAHDPAQDPIFRPSLFDVALGADDFEWLVSTGRTRWLWRMPRAGGAPSMFPTPVEPWPALFRSTRHGTVVAGGSLFALVPRDGSAVREMDMYANILGADDESAIWKTSRHLTGGDRSFATDILRVPLDGAAPGPLWSDIPLRTSGLAAWPDGRGGFVFVDGEPFSDGKHHVSVWVVAASGRATRVACGSQPGIPNIKVVAPAPDALYAVEVRTGGAGKTVWSLVRFPRPPP